MEIQKMTFNRKEAARYLGIAENTFSKLLKEGHIRYIRAGRRILVPKKALDEFLEN
jgi:excisionase family DNA binding protein